MRSRQRVVNGLVIFVMIANSFLFTSIPLAQATMTDGEAAILELGQYDASPADPTIHTMMYTKGVPNNSPNRAGMSFNGSLGQPVIDNSLHLLFVNDANNARVLVFQTNTNGSLVDGIADYIIGQPDFNTGSVGVTQSKLGTAGPLAYDSVNKHLFVQDTNRIMVFDLSGGVTTGMNASWVLGQTDFVSNGSNAVNAGASPACASGTNACGFNAPVGLSYDATNHLLAVGDRVNNRVLIFDLTSGITNGMRATSVLGQGTFTTSGANSTNGGASPACTSGINACGMSGPAAVAFDPSHHRLFVQENTNNRIKVYDYTSGFTSNMRASNVIGQTLFTTNTGAATISQFGAIRAVAYDSANNRIFAVDSGSHRVPVFNLSGGITDGMSASNILGQTSFTATGSNNVGATCSGVPNGCGMGGPRGAFYDATNDRLYIGDDVNNRIMVFDGANSLTNGQTATSVIGQGDFTGSGANGPSAFSFASPRATAIDSVHHRLFVADQANHRVVVYNLNSDDTPQDSVADYVLGQAGFSSSSASFPADRMASPNSLAYDSVNNRLFVADSSNNRVSIFDTTTLSNGQSLVNILGQLTAGTFTVNLQSGGCTGIPNACGMSLPSGVALDPTTNLLYVADTSNNRIMVFDVTPGNVTNFEPATYVIGQSGFATNASSNSQSGLSGPRELAVNSTTHRLFVADTGNNRVMVYSTSALSATGEPASNVLGQSGYGASGTSASQSGMNQPNQVAVDVAGARAFVSDFNNNRVLVFSTAALTNGEAASNVIGQPNFATTTSTTSQSGLAGPVGVTYNPITYTLVVGDVNNNRVIYFDAAPGSLALITTTQNTVSASRLKAGESTTMNFSFYLSHYVSTTLTITFPAGFTVTAPATGGSSCLSGFGFTSNTLTATKNNCSGTLTMTGATVTLPSTPGSYTISWVNDDPGSSIIAVVDSDTVSMSASVDPFITVNVGSQTAACSGSFAGSGGAFDFGALSSSSVTSSDASSVPHICLRISTNAASGAVATVKSANGALKSTSTVDTIPSSTTLLNVNTAGYGLCIGSDTADFGLDPTVPTGASVVRASPFNGSCTSSVHNIGALTTSAQPVISVSAPTQNAFARIYLKAGIANTTKAHLDYADTLTFIVTGTF